MEVKDQLRQKMRERRTQHFNHYSMVEESKQLQDLFFSDELLSEGDVIAAYWPTQSEIDIRPLLKALVQRGYQCGLPVTSDTKSPLLFREWRPGFLMVSDLYNILIPDEAYPLIQPTVVLVPLLAFDLNGNRLGHGAGYYDRTLAFFRKNQHIKCVGIAFDCQEVEKVPVDDHDERLDYIVTPTRIIRIAQ